MMKKIYRISFDAVMVDSDLSAEDAVEIIYEAVQGKHNGIFLLDNDIVGDVTEKYEGRMRNE